jgi:hypothetical protein
LRGADEFASAAAFFEYDVYLRVHDVSKIRMSCGLMCEALMSCGRMPMANVFQTNVLCTNADGDALKKGREVKKRVRLIGSKYLSTIGKKS